MTCTVVICLIASIFILAYVYSLIFAVNISNSRDGLYGFINKLHESCLLHCSHDICTSATYYRGDNYYIDSTDAEKKKKLKTCIMSFWSFTHFVIYLILGMIAPKYFILFFITGCVFELYEKIVYNCEDALDIFWNTTGLIIGIMINNYAYSHIL